MNKRLRKKKWKGEFDFHGFEVECVFDPPLPGPDGVDTFLDAFIDFVEKNDLGCGGGIDDKQMGQYLTKMVAGKRLIRGRPHFSNAHCTEEDRERVRAWVASQPCVTNLKVGPLVNSRSPRLGGF